MTDKKTYQLPRLERFGSLSDLTSEGSNMGMEGVVIDMNGNPRITMAARFP